VPDDARPDPQEPTEPAPVTVPDPGLRIIGLVRWGVVAWLVVLVVVLAVPSLRTGDRAWWVWVPVAGVLLGALGHVYLARGRGNARDA
jgi:hypothetical protein